MRYAAKPCDLEMVKWLHANRPENASSSPMFYCVTRGYLAVCKWLDLRKSLGNIWSMPLSKRFVYRQVTARDGSRALFTVFHRRRHGCLLFAALE